MQQIEIEVVGAETSEACLAGTRDAVPRHFITFHFRDQENAVALPAEHMAQELLGAAVAVVSRGIEQGHTDRDASTPGPTPRRWRRQEALRYVLQASLPRRRQGLVHSVAPQPAHSSRETIDR